MDIQQFLLEMRREQREDHNALVKKVDDGFKEAAAALNAHALQNVESLSEYDGRILRIDGRLKVVENTRRTVRWLGFTLTATALTGIVDYVMNHLHH